MSIIFSVITRVFRLRYMPTNAHSVSVRLPKLVEEVLQKAIRRNRELDRALAHGLVRGTKRASHPFYGWLAENPE